MPTATALADPAVGNNVAGPNTTLDDPSSTSFLSSLTSAPSPDFSSVTTPAVNDSSATSDNSGGLSSILSGLGTAASDVGSALNSPLGTAALLGGEYALISGQASATQTQNNALAGQISAIGQPDVTAGTNLLNSYTAGQLTAPFQEQLTAAQLADKNTATSQTQQVAQLLANSGGGQNVQSAQVSESGQIAAAKNLADTQAMSNAFMSELQSSLNLTSTGGAYVQAGIMQEIQSNTQLQQQLSQLMGQLAQAYAKSVSGSGSGTGTSGTAGTGTGLGSLFNQAGQLLNGGGPNVSSLVSGANAGAAQLGAGALTGDPTGVDAQLAAGANGPLTLATTDPYSVEVGDLVQDPALGLTEDVASTTGDAASVGGDIADFSAGSAAAGAAGSTLTAADLGAAAPDIASLATPSVASLLGGEGAAAGAEGAGAAAGAAGAGSSAVSALAAVAAPVAAALGIGYLAYEGLATHAPDTIKSVGPGQNVTTLQSGDQALQEGAFAIGTGSNQSQGAGQNFIIPQTTVTIDGKTAVAGQPFALPSSIVTAGDVTIPNKPGTNNQPDFASITYNPSATTASATTQMQALKQQMQNTGSGFGTSTNSAQSAALQAQYNSLALSASYNSTGGQAAWGVPFQTWLQQTYNVRQNLQGEVWE